MDAMIFAAGHGTRLRPLTDELPKALVPVGGVPILERVAHRLVDAGADRLIVNTHPFPERIAEHVRRRDGFGADVRLSHEPDGPLDTGGGLARARPLFRGEESFFLHNCDVLSDIDLRALRAAHDEDGDAIATLAVLPPSAERYLVFDERGLCGYSPRGGGEEVLVRETGGDVRRFDFTGIHVASPRLLGTLPRDGSFSIIAHYLRLAAGGERIAAHEQPGAQWIDIGTPARLAAGERFVRG